MMKSGSMPLHPAPPIPRNAAMLRESSKKAKTNVVEISPVQYSISKATDELLYKNVDFGSMDSMPKLDIDFSDLLAETDRRFADPDYMMPVKVPLSKTANCELIENDLYRPNQ